MDDFEVKALAEMKDGKGDGAWRATKPHGSPRIAINENGLHPPLRIDWQLDWLIHLRALFTLQQEELVCDFDLTFPHPTLIQRNDQNTPNNFNPEGLDLIIKSGQPCKIGYDIPYGISEYEKPGMNYFCALTSCFMQNEGNGILVSPQTGEQAFAVNTDEGLMKVYMGSSTTSGPIRNVGLTFKSKTNVEHEPAWYAEPFHGTYHHKVIIVPYKGKWQEAHLARKIESASAPVYQHECLAGGKGNRPVNCSFAQCEDANVEITMMQINAGKLNYRLNEREGRQTDCRLTVGKKTFNQKLAPYGIAGN